MEEERNMGGTSGCVGGWAGGWKGSVSCAVSFVNVTDFCRSPRSGSVLVMGDN